MILRQDLVTYLNQLLQCDTYNDYAPNGLQVEGKKTIKKIVTAVTASEEAITAAIQLKADALLVHHGYFWRGEDPRLVGMKGRRIKALLQQDLNLFAYHLPLDCHLELGNNACLGQLFELEAIKTHKVNNTPNLLWSGQFQTSQQPDVLLESFTEHFQRKPLHIRAGDKPIQSIAWCSGGAQDFIVEAEALGVDAYLSGEVSERTFYQAKELGIHYFACGHHATERYGIRALGQHLAQTFGLEHEFVDCDNPV